ncbi:MAG: hypothetical protein HZB26_02550 [Candidatus Hydrogenedentes bacterium]|nr:hypothetical protein [Candidatus Hydrogenedentota bacterium]
MRTAKLVLVTALLAAAWGCIPLSLNPVYTDKDLFYEPALEGRWYADSEEDGMLFEKAEANAYKVTMLDKGTKTVLSGHVFHLGKYVFLDLTLDKLPENAEWEKMHLVPFHSFFRVILDHDSLKLSTFDYDWTKNRCGKKATRGPWQESDERFILTGSSKEIQRYILKWVDKPGVFTDSDPLTRRAAKPETRPTG